MTRRGYGTGTARLGGMSFPVLDNDDPLYMRGFVLGILWESAQRDRWIAADVDDGAAEMVMRIAEAAGLPFAAEPAGEGMLHVVIGRPEDGPQ